VQEGIDAEQTHLRRNQTGHSQQRLEEMRRAAETRGVTGDAKQNDAQNGRVRCDVRSLSRLDALGEAMKSKEVETNMNNVGAGIVFLLGQQAADFLAKQDAIYRSIIDKLGLNVSAASMVHGWRASITLYITRERSGELSRG
jgi:hypothetical protein